MLKSIPPILGPELLYILRAMGHGDEIAIVDANFPAESSGPQVVRLDGQSATDVTDAILSLMPLDSYADESAICMQVVGNPDQREPIMDEFEAIVVRHETDRALGSLERFAFYERVETAYAIVQTGEARLYGNIILKKGIIRPN
ncbi:RbsD/FucU domain-containing protein [Devosia rhodophyticola]|uniref:RbsD/FucU domain-containing protein n=1 Tax=Devosia rhodophyticola TaxID=3026423 RepID=A0ABY7YU00_9HYPH|nr:RbsD/FucU domain-containing protein [Devosia rhodophyticola]WDR04820.1 RbsD/FucU domain-containing protein [Devosia rhodophyticola]